MTRDESRIAWILFLGLFSFFAFMLLLGPKVPDDQQAHYCVINLKGPGPFGLSLNCDSIDFLRLSGEPSRLLDENNVRQSRPGLSLLTGLLRIPFEPLVSVPDLLGMHASDPGAVWIMATVRRHFPGYVAHIVVNLCLMLALFWLFLRLAGPPADRLTAVGLASIGSLLAINDVSKAFFWSPHTILFTITVPLLGVWLTMQARRGALAQWHWAATAGALIGFGTTAYPLFALIVPCVLIVTLVHHAATRPGGCKTVCASAALFIAVSLAPMLGWYVFVKLKTGAFYSHEVHAYEQLVWILDAFARGDLLVKLQQNARELVTMAAQQSVAVFAVFVVSLFAIPRLPGLRSLLELGGIVLLVATVALAFPVLTGIVFARVAYGFLPPFIALAGALFVTVMEGASERRRKILAAACLLVAIGQLLHVLLKDGPYS